MPFRPELNFFFLYVKSYLEEKYKIRVERGDTNVLTRDLLNKISFQISEAAFLIADITGNNASVFFELGIAHERSKPVIFLTQDDPKDAPVDIRQFEFIHYDLGKHRDFLAKLDNAVRNVLGSNLGIQRLYQLARDILERFNLDTGFAHDQASIEEFHDRVVRAAESQQVPKQEETVHLLPAFLLPRIIRDTTDLEVMRRVTIWLENHEFTA